MLQRRNSNAKNVRQFVVDWANVVSEESGRMINEGSISLSSTFRRWF